MKIGVDRSFGLRWKIRERGFLPFTTAGACLAHGGGMRVTWGGGLCAPQHLQPDTELWVRHASEPPGPPEASVQPPGAWISGEYGGRLVCRAV
ncbi:MAG: hypothetical protein ACLU9S_11835 [Oscillospiraceae bacterium]